MHLCSSCDILFAVIKVDCNQSNSLGISSVNGSMNKYYDIGHSAQ